jgi:hypothetical protein
VREDERFPVGDPLGGAPEHLGIRGSVCDHRSPSSGRRF